MNENYGKLENGVLSFAPSNLIIEDEQVFNATAEEYLAAGYLPIEHTPKPNEGEWQEVYTEVDGIILQSWVYEGRVHDHKNLEVLNEVSSKSLSGVPAVHILLTDAKEGDLCLYAKPNTLTLADSGKKIYFDWEEFCRPIEDESVIDFSCQLDNNSAEMSAIVEFWGNRSSYSCFFHISRHYEDGSTEALVVGFSDGILNDAYFVVIDADSNETYTYFNTIDELPLYFNLSEFDTIMSFQVDGNAYLFHTEYKLMKYQGGEWSEVSDNSRALIDRIESAGTTLRIQPNIDYVFGNRETLIITFADGKENKRNEYMFSFTSGATPTILTLPDTVKWANELTIEANKRYEISIVDNIGLWCAVEVDV